MMRVGTDSVAFAFNCGACCYIISVIRKDSMFSRMSMPVST